MAIDISSIVRKHLSDSNTEVETAAAATDDIVTTDVVAENTELEPGTLKVDFLSIVEGTSASTDTVSVDGDYDWFMTEDERSTVQGALLAAIVTNAVSI